MSSLNKLTATDAARRIAAGEVSSEAIVADCLAHIREREPVVMAWQHLDEDYALGQARRRDAERPSGLLHGVPVGVKDIYDTHDMPTTWGTPIHADRHPDADAAVVALLRAAGAVILGKTVTTEFAGLDPGKTRNPHDSGRTPGGSSSGSASAVADEMVPVALGSQTAGSVIRPAAFCGVVGYKPSFGVLGRRGMAPIAEELDTVGYMARSVEDIALLMAVLTLRAPMPPVQPRATPLRVGVCRTHLWPEIDQSAADALDDAARRLAASGATLAEVVLPRQFADLTPRLMTLIGFEAARTFAHEWHTDRDRIGPNLQALIETGLETPYEEYIAACRFGAACRAELAALFEGSDVLLTVSAKGEAPEGLSSTGDTRFQSMWTFLHVPCITLPTARGPNGLPVGIQLVGPFHGDDTLLAQARWAADLLIG
jgi:Asp-tRNA(Asn)/Glu-tRNA(Gln) amidotransferase A subunit family amidase